MNYDPEYDLIRGDIRPDTEMVIRPYDVIFTNTVDIELELDGEFIEIPVQWIPELIACLSEAYRRAAGQEAPMAADQRRYRQLRNADLDAISQGGIFAGKTPENLVINDADLDQALDAMQEQEPIHD